MSIFTRLPCTVTGLNFLLFNFDLYSFCVCVFLGTLQSCGTGFLINLVFSVVGLEINPLKTGSITKVSMVFAGLYYFGFDWGIVGMVQTSYCLYLKFNKDSVCFISGVFEMLGEKILCDKEEENEEKVDKSDKIDESEIKTKSD